MIEDKGHMNSNLDNMNILVCGGAGYIGSHMIKLLAHQGYNVISFDNLSTGHSSSVRWGSFIEGDLLNKHDLETLFASHKIDLVMHFAAKSIVSESVQNPSLYYNNNVTGTINLLDVMRKYNVSKFIFSSSASVYGLPETNRIDENHPTNPINSYGHSKLMVEQILKYYYQAYGISSVSFRYFNAAGADTQGEIGEMHDPETHLIPNILKSVLNPQIELKIFGNDYKTPDGSCIRDYVHVDDLCDAHLKGANFLKENLGHHKFNLGNGRGFSVLDVINAVEKIIGKQIPYTMEKRREGDPGILVADASKANDILNWKAANNTIEDIVRTAWHWHSKNG